jgi:hypothetical protein
VALGHNFLKIINLKSQIFAIKYFLLAGAVAMLLEISNVLSWDRSIIYCALYSCGK